MLNLLSVLLETVLVSVHDRCMVCAIRTLSSEIIWAHPVELLGDMGHVESRFGSFRDSVSLGAR
jgi:hypothetical protein